MTCQVRCLRRVGVTVSNLQTLCRFYGDALGFSLVTEEAVAPDDARRLGLECSARRALLQLGEEQLELLCPETAGNPYPPHASATDAWFQHIAIVVSDMSAAYARVSACGITPVTAGGPQMLPATSGGVTAFKFRDPDGHPLELLAFPPGAGDPRWHNGRSLFLGFDHSAIVVRDTVRSLAFYEALGLSVTSRSLNHGAEQERLDGVAAVRADVVALQPAAKATPHIELLGYQNPPVVPLGAVLATADIASARLILSVAETGGTGLPGAPPEAPDALTLRHDPDGHALVFEPGAGPG